jgi:hypothetical protein
MTSHTDINPLVPVHLATSPPTSMAPPKLGLRQYTPDTKPPHWTQFPSNSSAASSHILSRNNSSSSSTTEEQAVTHHIEAEYAQYTDAPPPFTEDQYEGKTEDEQSRMRRVDYAKELNRMMGRQLVKGLKSEKVDVTSL